MTARHLASAVLACLLALFAHDQGGGVVTLSIVTGAAMFARFVAYPLIRGCQPSGAARRVMNACLVVGLWIGGLTMLATDWIPKNGFLPLSVLGGVWMLLDRPATRFLDTCVIAVAALAAIVVFSAIDEPDVVAVPLAGCIGLMLIIAFGMLDRARIVEALGSTRPRKPIKLDTWAVLVLLLICAPVAWFLPVPGTAREEAREEWRQGLDSIAGFSDRIDLSRLGLLKSNDNGALVVTVWEVDKDAGEVGGWRDVKMWRNDDEVMPNRHPLLLRGAALAHWDGKEFTRLPSGDRDPRFGESVDPAIGWKYVRQRVELAAHGHRTLFGMERVRDESIPEGQESVTLARHGELTARSPVTQATTYGVISRILPPPQRRFLVNKSAVHVDERYRSLKAIGPAVVRKARQELQSVLMRSDFEQVQHLERWFRFRSLGGFSYTRLNENAGPAPIETFLFETRAGHCEFFASAMVLMLRSVGIPARVAVGFRGGACCL